MADDDDDDDAAARSMSVDCSITSSRSSDPGEEGGLLCISKIVACNKTACLCFNTVASCLQPRAVN